MYNDTRQKHSYRWFVKSASFLTNKSIIKAAITKYYIYLAAGPNPVPILVQLFSVCPKPLLCLFCVTKIILNCLILAKGYFKLFLEREKRQFSVQRGTVNSLIV